MFAKKRARKTIINAISGESVMITTGGKYGSDTNASAEAALDSIRTSLSAARDYYMGDAIHHGKEVNKIFHQLRALFYRQGDLRVDETQAEAIANIAKRMQSEAARERIARNRVDDLEVMIG
jgi:hypothetical protein